eukprot:tig00021339_g20413.t1
MPDPPARCSSARHASQMPVSAQRNNAAAAAAAAIRDEVRRRAVVTLRRPAAGGRLLFHLNPRRVVLLHRACRQVRLPGASTAGVIAYQNSDFESSPKYVYMCESVLTNNPSAFLKVKQNHGDVPVCIDKEKEKEAEEGAAGGSSKAGPACRLFVEVTPEAPRTQLVAINDTAVTILATGSSQGARVNEEVLSFLAFVLGVGPGAVTLEGGSKSAKKTLRVAGLGPREAHDRLFAALR